MNPVNPLYRLLVAALLLLSVASSVSAGAPATPDPAATPATPATPAVAADVTPYPLSAEPTAIIVSATNDPFRVPGSDGMDHLEYDLIVTNIMPADLTLTSVDVTASSGDPLLQLTGDDLVSATQPVLGGTPTPAIAAGTTVAVVIDVAVTRGTPVDTLNNQVTYSYPDDAFGVAIIGSYVVSGPELTVDIRQPIVIASPLRGDGWMSFNACCSAASIHRYIRVPADGNRIAKAETFAVDWIQLRDGAYAEGDGSAVEDWYDFGADVMSVADGTVVYARDDMPEEATNQRASHVFKPEDYAGNQVIVQIAPDVYALYAHLQTGSVAVAVGDRVATGQPIGKLGNSGNTTGPHLHFSLLDSPNPLTGESLPMVIDSYTLEGTISPDQLAGTAGPPDLTPQGPAQPQTATFPLWLAVSSF